MKELLFASANPHKLSEINALLAPLNRQVRGLQELGFDVDIPETGETLEENAAIKARFLYAQTGRDCFADDTGLEVEALAGAPGVYSARYAGEPANSERNIEKLLTAMEHAKSRKARFRTVICLIRNGEEQLFEGVVNGSISAEKSGSAGFGYDPVFVPEGHNLSFAEMTPELKNSMSHRSRALAAMLQALKTA